MLNSIFRKTKLFLNYLIDIFYSGEVSPPKMMLLRILSESVFAVLMHHCVAYNFFAVFYLFLQLKTFFRICIFAGKGIGLAISTVQPIVLVLLLR